MNLGAMQNPMGQRLLDEYVAKACEAKADIASAETLADIMNAEAYWVNALRTLMMNGIPVSEYPYENHKIMMAVTRAKARITGIPYAEPQIYIDWDQDPLQYYCGPSAGVLASLGLSGILVIGIGAVLVWKYRRKLGL